MMSEESSPSPSQSHEIMKLLFRAFDCADSVEARRGAILQGLAELLDADAWVWSHARLVEGGSVPMPYNFVFGGWTDERSALFVQCTQDRDFQRLIYTPYLQYYGTHATVLRRDLLADDEQWYHASFFEKYCKPSNLDDFMWMTYPLGEGVSSGLALYRRCDQPPFTEADRQLVHMVTGELKFLHREGADIAGSEKLDGLSRRQREVLLMLLRGDSRKQVAYQLSISEHTVNDYVKGVYQHFNVSSLGELAAQFIGYAL